MKQKKNNSMNLIGIVLIAIAFPLVASAENRVSEAMPQGLIAEVQALRAELSRLNNRITAEQVPVGTVIVYAGPVEDTGEIQEPIPGYLLCNGAVIDPAAEDGMYEALVNALGTSWGNGGDEDRNTVNLPDLRGVFLRGVSGKSEDDFADPELGSRTYRHQGGGEGNEVGSFQMDTFKAHDHHLPKTIYIHGRSFKGENASDKPLKDSSGNEFMDRTKERGGSETRPKNANVVYLIKY